MARSGWQQRVKDFAAYTSPSGERFLFDYEDVSTSHDKLTSAFEFPDVQGTYVQDLGRSGRRLPMRCFIWGDNYDIRAAEFEAGLLEKGVGTLEHPLYGTFDVVPFGTITRNDSLKTAANQAVFEVAFWETTGAVYPGDQDSPTDDAEGKLEAYNEASASQFDFRAQLDRAVAAVTFRNQIRAALAVTRTALQAVADVQQAISRGFTAIFDSIDQGIDLLIQQPLTLGFQCVQLVELPARSFALIKDRLNAYENMIDTLVGQDLPTTGFDNRPNNLVLTLDLFATTAVAGAALASLSGNFKSRAEAIAAADQVSELLVTVTDWRDGAYEALRELDAGDEPGRVDTGEAYQALQSLVAATLGALVATAFELPPERTISLSRAHTVIDLCAELYGEGWEDRLDEFISQNDLTGDQLLELPIGTLVTYYVV